MEEHKKAEAAVEAARKKLQDAQKQEAKSLQKATQAGMIVKGEDDATLPTASGLLAVSSVGLSRSAAASTEDLPSALAASDAPPRPVTPRATTPVPGGMSTAAATPGVPPPVPARAAPPPPIAAAGPPPTIVEPTAAPAPASATASGTLPATPAPVTRGMSQPNVVAGPDCSISESEVMMVWH